jgi:hypothetical protein
VFAIADHVADLDAKRELVGIAEKYEWLAKRADENGSASDVSQSLGLVSNQIPYLQHGKALI